MGDGAQHAAHGGRGLQDDRGPDPSETEAAQRRPLARARADRAPAERRLHDALAHDPPAPGLSSARVLPRSSATFAGSFSIRRASIVARTMLCGLFDPMHLVRTFEMPASSTTARTPPPAMTPVPSDAGLSSTEPAPKLPITSYGIVPSAIGTRIMLFFASSIPLRI